MPQYLCDLNDYVKCFVQFFFIQVLQAKTANAPNERDHFILLPLWMWNCPNIIKETLKLRWNWESCLHLSNNALATGTTVALGCGTNTHLLHVSPEASQKIIDGVSLLWLWRIFAWLIRHGLVYRYFDPLLCLVFHTLSFFPGFLSERWWGRSRPCVWDLSTNKKSRPWLWLVSQTQHQINW